VFAAAEWQAAMEALILVAATYATKLQKKEANTPEWQAAIESLILVATSG
jgi:hypothetical protein